MGVVYNTGAPAKYAELTALFAASILAVLRPPADAVAMSNAISVNGVTDNGCKFVTLSNTACSIKPAGAGMATPASSSSICVDASAVTTATTGPAMGTGVAN